MKLQSLYLVPLVASFNALVGNAATEMQVQCVQACGGSVNCCAGCFSTASPTPQQIQDTNNCIVKNCKVLDSNQATQCQISCVYNYFLNSPGSSGSGTTTGSTPTSGATRVAGPQALIPLLVAVAYLQW